MLTSNPTQPTLSNEDFLAVRDFIYEKSGIWFGENKKYLIENRLAKRISELGIATYKDYFYRVKYDTSLKEFDVLMNLVTTNETSFFRNPPQLKAFSEEVLPMIIKEKKESPGSIKRLKIWSAGCSTGEEPYTLGIIALERMHSMTGWNIEIIANDISQQVLYAARKGLYQESTLRTTDQRLIDKYFTKEGNFYRVKDEVKRLVKFNHVNLNDARQVGSFNDCDAIFCRNVMIYFSDDIKRSLVKQFYKSLRAGGFFFIGHSESLHGISKSFKLEYLKNALVYKKEATRVETTQKVTNKVADSHTHTVDTLSKIRELLNKK
ncbi:MAG: protein-glutamate O-methyltransferase CheR [candidate division Zixibacteria bacterium]|nr:protein-glutamate O-methyltransferase CheR [candidate division Zixibacteria bacterium]